MKTFKEFMTEAQSPFMLESYATETESVNEESVHKGVAKLISKYKKHKTDDYQRRGGNAPRGGIPDSIVVGGWKNEFFMEFTFKDTDQRSAENWVKKLLGSAAKQWKITSNQDGDYRDDWVIVYVQKLFDPMNEGRDIGHRYRRLLNFNATDGRSEVSYKLYTYKGVSHVQIGVGGRTTDHPITTKTKPADFYKWLKKDFGVEIKKTRFNQGEFQSYIPLPDED